MEPITVEIKPLTPIWTGDANRKCKTLKESGIIGSLRWWYEAVIRGYGGTACNPTETDCDKGKHCDACELFGCTGWSRKFRFEIEGSGEIIKLKFKPLREIDDVEWALLNKTLTIIANYGAIGGKIAEWQYGLIEIKSSELENYKLNKNDLENYFKKRGSSVDNPDISNFFFVNRPDGGKTKDLKDECEFLKGQGPRVAKRYFYKTKNGKPYRYFAYAKDSSEFEKIKKFLNSRKIEYLEGSVVLRPEGGQ